MRIMLSAVHATGKSTTANAVADRLPSLLYVPSFAANVAKAEGFDLNKQYTSADLLRYQNRVLEAFQMHYELTADINTIYDRSPLDFACYLTIGLADKDWDAYAWQHQQYVKKCFEVTNAYCDILIYPKSDLSLVYESKSNRPNCTKEEQKRRVEYDELLQTYLSGVSCKKIIVPDQYQYNDRVDFLVEELKDHV